MSRRAMVWRLVGLEGPEGAPSSSSTSSTVMVGRRWAAGSAAEAEPLGTGMLLLLERPLGEGWVCWRRGALAGAVVSEGVSSEDESDTAELEGCVGGRRRGCCLDGEGLGAAGGSVSGSSDDSTMSTSISPWRFGRGEAREGGSRVRVQSLGGWGFCLAATFLRREVLGPPCCWATPAIRAVPSSALGMQQQQQRQRQQHPSRVQRQQKRRRRRRRGW